MEIGAFEAKTHFSEIIEEVQKGKTYVITKRGKPVAKMVPFTVNSYIRKEVIKQLSEYNTDLKEKFNIKAAIKSGRK